jgi:hypothetical protein
VIKTVAKVNKVRNKQKQKQKQTKSSPVLATNRTIRDIARSMAGFGVRAFYRR